MIRFYKDEFQQFEVNEIVDVDPFLGEELIRTRKAIKIQPQYRKKIDGPTEFKAHVI